ncbi:MAG TPA: hypothetical protein VFJ02_15865 [Vicinamibacterales bacterium]|nr:hypothetical protein [Vicinamibacterales bacterium]
MAMVIALFAASMVLTAITAVLLSAAVRTADSSAPVRENPRPIGPPRFFAQDIPLSVHAAGASHMPVDLLVLEIERHVRQERAAAESFHLSPTAQTLHVQTASPLMH